MSRIVFLLEERSMKILLGGTPEHGQKNLILVLFNLSSPGLRPLS